MTSVALLLIGFSVFSAPLMAAIHLRSGATALSSQARWGACVALAALGGLQVAHWGWLYLGQPWVESGAYRVMLFAVAPAMWMLCRSLLRPNLVPDPKRVTVLHALPAVVAPWLSAPLALPLAFVVGAGYLVAVAVHVYRLRAQREQFARELLSLGAVFLIALGVAVLGIARVQLPGRLFEQLYASCIGAAFLLVQVALAQRPRLAEDIAETARSAYAQTTLARVDREAAIQRLAALMGTERLYENPDLSLPQLAQTLGLSAHQLSELMNTELGKSFPRYLREQRVAAACAMLLAEPAASVLSVGLNVGFGTQSSFYDAFREIQGMTPGQYRRLHARGRRGTDDASADPG